MGPVGAKCGHNGSVRIGNQGLAPLSGGLGAKGPAHISGEGGGAHDNGLLGEVRHRGLLVYKGEEGGERSRLTGRTED